MLCAVVLSALMSEQTAGLLGLLEPQPAAATETAIPTRQSATRRRSSGRDLMAATLPSGPPGGITRAG
jgi:hypothetical protein